MPFNSRIGNQIGDRIGNVWRGHLAAACLTLCSIPSAEALNAKRGWADTSPSVSELSATNAGWFYRWGLSRPSGNYASEFVPMFWGGGSVTAANINQVRADGNVTHVLGFNEPERSNQANLSVSTAVDKWQTLHDGFLGSGIQLVSPAVSDNADGRDWLSEFMTEVDNRNLQVDAVAFHWYGVDNPNNPAGAANQLLNRVDAYHAAYGRPIWLTEFALHDWGGNYSDEEMRVANQVFLEHVIPGLESRSYVEKFAFYNWFSDSTLVEGNPLAPTNVGDPYVGTIRDGAIFDLAGTSHENFTFFLKEGEITNQSTLPGDLRYIDALEGTNRLAGVGDWSVAAQGSVRIRGGAALSKFSANRVSWVDIPVINDGEVRVEQGTLHLEQGTRVNGTGTLRVNAGGTLRLGKASDRSGVGIHQTLRLEGGTLEAQAIADGTHVLAHGATLQGAVRFGGDGALIAQGPLLDGGGGRLIKEDVGTLRLLATSTYAGDTVVRAGTLHLADHVELPNSSSIQVDSGGTWDVSSHTTSYPLRGQTLRLAGHVEGSLHATAGSDVTAVGNQGTLSGNLRLTDSTLRFADLGTAPTIVTTGLRLNFDAAEDIAGDTTWTNAAAPGDDLAFASAATPISVADGTFTRLQSAYDIAASGAATGLNNYFELGAPARSRQDATFEVVFHVPSDGGAPDQVLFEAGATRGVSFLLSGDTLSFNVDGDGAALSLTSAMTPGWHHAVGVIDLTGDDDNLANDRVELYVNNQRVGELSDVLVDDWAGGNIAGIGGPASGVANSSAPGTYQGAIASARYYQGQAFTPAQVSQNYQALLDPSQFLSAAALHVEGQVTLMAGATVAMNVFSDASHDQLTTSGTLSAGGTLAVTLMGDSLNIGDQFAIFSADTFHGAFDAMDLPVLAPGQYWETGRLLTDGTLEVSHRASADVDRNGILDGNDLDLLVMEIVGQSHSPLFDLDGDGSVDANDVTHWLAHAGAVNLPSGNPYLLGDANLDGVVDVSDFNLWNTHKFSTSARWTQGDFNADGVSDVSDFNLWNANKFSSSETVAVPEPSEIVFWLGSLIVIAATRRRPRSCG